MKHWLKLLVSIALAISIPLQGVAAVTMPICEDVSAPALSMKVDNESYASVMSTSVDCHTMSTSNCSDESNKDCSKMKCSFCHVSVYQLPETNKIDGTNDGRACSKIIIHALRSSYEVTNSCLA